MNPNQSITDDVLKVVFVTTVSVSSLIILVGFILAMLLKPTFPCECPQTESICIQEQK